MDLWGRSKQAFKQRKWKPFLVWGIGAVGVSIAQELIRDKLSGWANDQIEAKAPEVATVIERFLAADWLPLAIYPSLAVLIIAAFIFVLVRVTRPTQALIPIVGSIESGPVGPTVLEAGLPVVEQSVVSDITPITVPRDEQRRLLATITAFEDVGVQDMKIYGHRLPAHTETDRPGNITIVANAAITVECAFHPSKPIHFSSPVLQIGETKLQPIDYGLNDDFYKVTFEIPYWPTARDMKIVIPRDTVTFEILLSVNFMT